jgi:membrane-associated phospholipid phosphatase
MKYFFKNQIVISLVILTISFNIKVLGQQNCLDDTTHTTVLQDISHGLNDGIKLVNSLSNFTSRDWIYLGGIAGITAGSFFIDKSIRNTVAKNHTSTLNDITKVGEYFGTAQYMVILSGATYLTGKIIQNNDVSETGRMLLETLAYAGIITTVLKVGLGRARPYMEKGPYDFFNFNIKDNYLSLPSGHTTVAFAISSVLAAKIKNTYASIALYGLAGLTMYQRIYSDRHWFSDAFLGAAISTVIGNAIVELNECTKKTSENSLTIFPLVQTQSIGLSFTYSF